MVEIVGIETPQQEPVGEVSPIGTSGLVDTTEPVQEPTGNNDTPPTTEEPAPVAQVTEPAPAEQTDAILDALIAAIAPAHTATKHMKIFVYGMEGCGKTVMAAQAPGPLLADCDKEGAISLLNHPTLRDTKTFPVRSIFAVEQLVKYLKAGVPQFDWVETLIIDPFDDLVYRGLSEQVRNTPTIPTTGDRANQYLAEGYDYNANTERFHQIMDEIKSLDRHVILTAHVTEKEDKKTGRIMIRSNLTPKLATIIGGAVSLVGYMTYDAESNTRYLYTAPTGTIAAKTRLGLPPVIENPSFNIILDAFNKIKDQTNVNS